MEAEQAPAAAANTEPDPQQKLSEVGAAQGRAARQLLSSLINEPELAEIKRHQASTLKELAKLKTGLTALNKLSADEYSRSASEYARAARLAGQVKTDLNDISRRITTLKKKLGALQEPTEQPPASGK